jgi:hypothetical protein
MKPSARRNLMWLEFNYERHIPSLGGISVPRIILPDTKFHLHVTWCSTRKKIIYIKRPESPT